MLHCAAPTIWGTDVADARDFRLQQPLYDDAETKRILRKVDYRLLPVLTILYILSYLDRSNIGNARVAGMNADLGLTGKQYNIALMVCHLLEFSLTSRLTLI